MNSARNTSADAGLVPDIMDNAFVATMPTRSALIASDGLPASRSIEGIARAVDRMRDAKEDVRLAAIHLLLRVVDRMVENGEDEDYEAAIMLAKWCRDWKKRP